MGESYNFSVSGLLMALLSLFFSGVVGIGTEKKKENPKVKLNGYQTKPKATKVAFVDQVEKKNKGLVRVEKPKLEQSGNVEEVKDCFAHENEKKNPKVKMNGYQTKPKATKVAFVDQVEKKNKGLVRVEKQISSRILEQSGNVEEVKDCAHKNEKKNSKVKMNGYQTKPKATKVTFVDQVEEKNKGLVWVEKQISSLILEQSGNVEEVKDCIAHENEKKNPKVKMNGYQTKPKATKVTFVDQVEKKNKGSVQVENPISRQPLKPTKPESDQAECEEEVKITKGVNECLVLTPVLADRMQSYLDTMNIRTVLLECTTAKLHRKNLGAARARLDLAMELLDDVPRSMSFSEREAYMMDICQYVKAIFDGMERQAIKMIKCHGDTLCEIIKEFDDSVLKIETDDQEPEKKVDMDDFEEDIKSDREKALRALEAGTLAAFFVLTFFVTYLLTRPNIGRAFGQFMFDALSGTLNSTFGAVSSIESISSGVDIFGNLGLPPSM